MFWQKDLETIEKRELEKLQLERLRKWAAVVYEKVPLYRRKYDKAGVLPENLLRLKDIEKLPFTTREDLREAYPLGMLATGMDKVVRLHTSSGTTGKPKALIFTRDDLDQQADLIARALVMSGMTNRDILQNMMTYGLFTGSLVMHYGAEKLGMFIIPSGPGNTDRQISFMRDFGTTALHITPSYAFVLANTLLSKGINPARDLSLKTGFLGAEPYTEATRRKIEELLSIDVYNCYGLSEMGGPGVAFECPEKNGLHVWEDKFLLEIINPENGACLPDGEKGELVLTSLCKEAMPILRYRTGDLTSVIPEPCSCGRTHRKISRFSGRVDDMFIIKGVNIFPQQIERVLMGIPGVGQNYLITLESLDDILIQVEILKEYFDGDLERLKALKDTITGQLKTEISVKPKVELMEHGGLPASEGKAKRVIDKRTM